MDRGILTNEEILEQLGDDFDITICQICGENIVIPEAMNEYPVCNTTQCVGAFLASNY